jgi:phosphoribosylaminoimidazole carboxylase
VNCDVLDELEAEGTVIHPSPKCIRIIQDKYKQKLHFQTNGIALAPFINTPDIAAATAAGAEWGFPFMLKARLGAYDGKGNAVVESAEGIQAAFESLYGARFSTGICTRGCSWFPCLLAEGSCMRVPNGIPLGCPLPYQLPL